MNKKNLIIASLLSFSFSLCAFAQHVDVSPIDANLISKLAHKNESRDNKKHERARASIKRHLAEIRSLYEVDRKNDAEANNNKPLDAYSKTLITSKQYELSTFKNDFFSENKNFTSKVKQKISSRFEKLNQALEAVKNADTEIVRRQKTIELDALVKKYDPDNWNNKKVVRSSPGNFFMVPQGEVNLSRSKPARATKYLSQAEISGETEISPNNNVLKKNSYAKLSQESGVILAAYKAGDNQAPLFVAAPPVKDQTLSCYADEAEKNVQRPLDLNQSAADAVVTPEIEALAEALEYNPVKILEYVKNEIEFELYLGSVKGALGALQSKNANAFDHSSLLISLLRASNVPARYVRGSVILDPAKQEDLYWFKTSTEEQWRSVISGTKHLVSSSQWHSDIEGVGGNKEGVVVQHVWVEACIPYANYRGIDSAAGAGHMWVPMEASYKARKYKPGVGHDQVFDYDGYFTGRTKALPHEAFEEQLESAIRAVDPNLTIADVVDSWETPKVELDILPSALPFPVVSFSQWSDEHTLSEISEIPDKWRSMVEIKVFDENNQSVLEETIPSSKIATSRLTLSFEGSSSQDQVVINNWRQSQEAFFCADIGSTSVRPVIKIDGVATAGSQNSTSFTVCSGDEYSKPSIKIRNYIVADQWAPYQFNPPGYSTQYYTFNSISPLAYHAIQAYANHGSQEYIKNRNAMLLEGLGDGDVTASNIDETLGEYLNLVLVKYFSYFSNAAYRAAELHGDYSYQIGQIGLTSTAAQVGYIFDLPYAIDSNDFLVDVPGGVVNTVTKAGTPGFESFKLAGFSSSAYESYIWQENALKDAVSTISGLQIAAEQKTQFPELGMDIRKVNSVSELDNFIVACSTVITENCYPSDIVAHLRGLFSGITSAITIPNKPINYSGWLGVVYVSEETVNGQIVGFGFPIRQLSGDTLSGGYTVPTINTAVFNIFSDTGYDEVSTHQALSSSSASTNTFNMDSVPSNVGTAGSGIQPNNTIFGDPVNMLTGNMYHPETDISIPTKGLPFMFQRYYNSREVIDGPLGYGWTHSFNHTLEFRDAEGNGDVTHLVWTNGTGAKKFIAVDTNNQFEVGEGNFFTVSSETVQAERVCSCPPGVICGPCPPNPIYYTAQKITITERDGSLFEFEPFEKNNGHKGKLVKISDKFNHSISLSYTIDFRLLISAVDDDGRKIQFNYDKNQIDNRIRSIDLTWANTHYEYKYDAEGNLTEFYTPLAIRGDIEPHRYEYYSDTDGQNHNHLLKSFEYSNGYKMTFEYYVNGKTFRHYNNDNETITFTYNDYIRESTSVDELGHVRKYYFNEKGLPVKTVEADGSKTVYKYDDVNDETLRTSHINPMGYETKTEYDIDGNVTKQIMPSGSFIEKSHFNSFGMPKRIKNANGDITLIKYSSDGKATDKVVFKSGQGSSINADTFNPVSYASSILSWSAFDYSTSGKLIRTRSVKDFTNRNSGPYAEYNYVDTENNINDVNMVSTTYYGDLDGDGVIDASEKYGPYETAYDELSKPLESFSGAKYPVSIRYDENGRVIESTDGVGNQRQFAYDPSGLPVGQSLVDVVDGVPTILDQSSAGYNNVGRRISSSSITGATSAYEYNARGQVIKTTSPDGYVIHIDYDEMGRAVKAYDAEGHAVKKEYDYLGRVLSTTDPNGNTVSHSYYGPEENGKLHQVTDAKGRVSTFVYNDQGLVSQVTDHAGRVTRSFYDALGRATRIESPSYVDLVQGTITPVTTYEYSNLGHKTKIYAGYMSGITDTLKIQATYAYDDFGRVLTQTNALNKSWAYTYDEHGNVKTINDPENQTTTFNYEYGGLLKNKTTTGNANGTLLVEYTYNALGQPLTIASDNVIYSYAYDHANRLESITDSRENKKVSYEYSIGGLLNKIIDGEGNSTAYLYDPVGRLTAVRSPDKKLTSYMYDAGGRLSRKTYPNNIASNYTYDADNSLLGINTRNTATDSEISEHTYGYHPLTGYLDSSIHTMSGITESRSYNYDNLGRILNVQNSADSSVIESFTYDPYGNRKTHTKAGTTNFYQHNDMHQIESIRAGSASGSVVASFSYDNNGNQLTKTEGAESLTLDYDGWGRLIQANKTGLPQENYTYDHSVKRIATSVGGTTNNYQYSGGAIIGEYDSNWELMSNFTHGPGSDDPLVRFAGGASTYYHADALGSVVATSNNAGAVQSTARYGAFGDTTLSTGNIAQYGYTGREPSATGLMYYRARFYDPSIGRFTQSDPMGFIDGVNTYAYVANNPINYVDPTGMTIDAISNTLSSASGYVSQIGDDWAAYTNSESANRVRGGMMVAGGHYGSDPELALQASLNLGGGYAEGAESMANVTSGTSTIGLALSVVNGRGGRGADSSGNDVPKTPSLYRGVSANHPELAAARNGNVVPGNVNGTVTPEMHNAGGHAANSPYTSWTRDPNIAAQQAVKHGDGGVVLRVPQGAPPEGSSWSWEWSPDIYGEQEVLMRGARSSVEVLK